MAFSLTSLSKSLSSLLPSRQSLPNLPQNPPNFAPPVSQSDPKSTSIRLSSCLTTPADETNAITCPSLAYANTLFFKSGHYNVQVVVADNEPEDKLLGRFRRAVFKAGVIQECKRRMFFESSQEKRKRKVREASKRNRRRRPKPKESAQSKEETSKKDEDEEDGDNWELPEGDLPY